MPHSIESGVDLGALFPRTRVLDVDLAAHPTNKPEFEALSSFAIEYGSAKPG
jgi:hypothetical protein